MMFTTLRWYQEDITKAVNDVFNNGASRILTVLPCGGGKTFTAVDICKPYPRILWLAHRKRLLQQAKESFVKTGRNDVIFHSVFSAPNPRWGKFDLVVLDESHREACRTIRDLQDKLKFDRFIGLTATPNRTPKNAFTRTSCSDVTTTTLNTTSNSYAPYTTAKK